MGKTKPASLIAEAISAGIKDIGENYLQEALDKQSAVSGEARWHFLGHLQSNKSGAAIMHFDVIQSLDSIRLAHRLSRQAQTAGKTQKVLLEVHLGDEISKFGFVPAEVLDTAAEIGALPGLDVQGLMGIAPGDQEPRPYFAQLRRLFEALPAENRITLSMGMTNDFETAIAEGTTMIRIGTAIFGRRTSSE